MQASGRYQTQTMRAACLSGSAQAPVLVEKEIPRPWAKAGEVLVRVRAAGVTITELGWYPTWHTKTDEPRTDTTPCHEFSGEIAEIGHGVDGLSIGQEIYGMNDWYVNGALADFCVTDPGSIAPKPRRLSHAEAASVPIDALTAWQGLYEKAKLKSGERVLIHGGAGAVGIFAIQLARMRGANVITTVSARNIEFVKTLGADLAIDYQAAPFESQVRDVDVVFDVVGGDTLRRSWSVLKPDGRLVTIVSNDNLGSDERAKQAFFIVEPRHAQLVEVARLLDAGELRPVVDRVLPFSLAPETFAGTIEKKGRGKLVIAVT